MRTDEKLQSICNSLTINCGDLHGAALSNGVSPAFLNSWIKEDKVAADAFLEAQRVGWMGLESAAIKRAVHGVEEDVWYKGEKVAGEGKAERGKITYSDSLLARLLEARAPAFKKGESNATFNGPTQINIMPRADNYEDWLAMKDATLSPDRQLPSPQTKLPDILQGEYTDYTDLSRPLAGLAGVGL